MMDRAMGEEGVIKADSGHPGPGVVLLEIKLNIVRRIVFYVVIW